MRFKISEHIDNAYFRGTSALKCGSMLSFVSSMSTESGKRLFVFISIGPSGLQLEPPLSGRMNQPACAPARRSGGVTTPGRLSRYHKEPVPDGGNHGLGLTLIQYLFLEQIHEVVSQHQQLKPCPPGRQASSR
ncbi:MAG: hypothetical protein JRI39_12785 [Deltaproteobacteria bacterium]|nr:hypothetical protein [Deltaproteobacteria bacterium]